MKWLLVVVLVVSVAICGCDSGTTVINRNNEENRTGFECFSCQREVAKQSVSCPHCGQPFNEYWPHATKRETDEMFPKKIPSLQSVMDKNDIIEEIVDDSTDALDEPVDVPTEEVEVEVKVDPIKEVTDD